jgi:hypothetical protein
MLRKIIIFGEVLMDVVYDLYKIIQLFYLRETGYGPTDRSVGVLWFVSGALFLGSSGSVHRC